MKTSDVLSRLRPELTKLQAYAVPDAAGLVKLDAMENPFTWPVAMRTKWLDRISHAQINRYPEPNPEGLKQKLKHQFGPHDSSSGILLGNGSDELIQLLVLAVAKPGACILTVSPSFSMYQMIAEMIGVECHVVPLDENYQLDCAAMLTAIENYDPALIFLAYPNNPTGNLWSRDDIQAILHSSKGIVVIDEAYGPFAADSFTDDLENNNMLLLRTASKMGLAAIRFGWLAGDGALIAELNKIRLPYNINQLTQLTMDFALDNYELFAEQAETIRALRGSMFGQLSAIEGVNPYISDANFILFKVLTRDASEVFDSLLVQKVLIKNVSKQVGLNQCLRVTVGSKEENKIFCEALITALKN